FCTEIVRLAEADPRAALGDDLRDWALRNLAGKLRQRAALKTRSGDIIATLFGQPQAWPAAVVSDANHAWRAAVSQAATPAPARTSAGVVSVRVGNGTVTAACFAPQSGDLVLGF